MSNVRRQNYKVNDCPVCHEDHEFTVAITYRQLDAPPLFFGGKTESSSSWDVIFNCPSRGKKFPSTIQVSLASNEEVFSVETVLLGQPISETLDGSRITEEHDWLKAELLEKIITSTHYAQDFCKTMITTSSGAVAIYFGVSKYLGVEAIHNYWAGFGLIPPLLFLIATTVFVIGIRPSLVHLSTEGDYSAVREALILRLNMFIKLGLSLFLAGLVIAVAIWTYLIVWSNLWM